jgi:hypothetical protein
MREIEKTYFRCFNTPSGGLVLRHLRSITVERCLGANASESELRGLEAQRALVRMMEKLSGGAK